MRGTRSHVGRRWATLKGGVSNGKITMVIQKCSTCRRAGAGLNTKQGAHFGCAAQRCTEEGECKDFQNTRYDACQTQGMGGTPGLRCKRKWGAEQRVRKVFQNFTNAWRMSDPGALHNRSRTVPLNSFQNDGVPQLEIVIMPRSLQRLKFNYTWAMGLSIGMRLSFR